MASMKFHNSLRRYHRWLGFFLAGIMAVYALSGILLIFRTTDFLQYEQTVERQLRPGLAGAELGESLRMKGFKLLEETDNQVRFEKGIYDKSTGVAVVTDKDYPLPLAKLVNLHKATTNSPLFWLNITFGVGLLFFVVSAFLMFLPKTSVYKNGLLIAGAGFVFALLMVVFGSA